MKPQYWHPVGRMEVDLVLDIRAIVVTKAYLSWSDGFLKQASAFLTIKTS